MFKSGVRATTIVALAKFSFIFSASALATTPVVDNQLPSAGLAGEQVCFGAAFSHTGDAGFGPYLRVISDPELNLDSASLFGSGISATVVGTFPTTPPFELEDPLTKTKVTGLPGQEFEIITKSVGSVVAGGPELVTEICTTIDASATIGAPLNLSIAPVYRFGDSSTGVNGPVEGSAVNKTITPELYEYTFSAASPEQEIAPNPNVAINFVHTANVADAGSINNLNISQVLPTELIATSAPTITGGINCVATSAPSIGVNGGSLEVDCSQVNGTSSTDDVQIRYSAIVDKVLNINSCAALPISLVGESNAESNTGAPLSNVTNGAQFDAKHVVLRQELSGGALIPGQSYTVTNNVEVSAYANPSQTGFALTDTLSDGLSFGSVSSITAAGGSITYAPTVTTNSNGTQTIVFDLDTAGIDLANGNTLQIVYSVSVEQNFRASSAPVLANDSLGINSALQYGLEGGASACLEDSGSAGTVVPITIDKSIVGGATDFDPGDGISFLLSIDVPSGDIPAFSVTDFLPLAVFDADDVSTTFGPSSASNVEFGPADDLGQVPTITIDSATNGVILSFPALSNVGSNVLEYQLNAEISTDPYADGLTLTNIMQSTSANTAGDSSVLLSPVSFQARAPALEGSLIQTLPTVKDAGDSVSYSLELENVGSADAFDIGVDLANDPGLEGGVFVSAQVNGSSVSTSGSFADGDFVIAGPLAPSDTVVLVFTREIDDSVSPKQSIVSKAEATWASAPSINPFPAIETEASFNIDDLSIATTVISVSPEGSTGNVVVGDVVTYQTEITLPEGDVEDFNIDYLLPAGFAFVANSTSVTSTGFNGTVSASPSATVQGVVNNQQSIEVLFSGNTITSSDNDPSNNTFTLSFEAIVEDDAANAAISALQNKELQSTAQYSGIMGTAPASNASANFAEHNLVVSTVATNASGASGGFEAGDEVTVQVTIANTGTAPAYDVVFDSIVNGDLFDLTTVVPVTTPAPYTYAYNNPTVSYTASNVTLNPNNDIVFEYRARVRDDVRSGSDFTVISSATGSSLSGTPAVERVRTQSDDAILDSLNPTIGNLQVIATSEVFSDSVSRDIFAIGEVVTYQFEASLPEGVTGENPSNSLLSVLLPRSYQYQANSALIRAEFDTSLNSANEGDLNAADTAITPSINGQRLNFNLGDITNNDDDADEEKIFVTFDVLVLNNQFNNRNNRKNVRADIAFINQSSVAQSNSTSATSFIGEPRLGLNYSVQSTTVVGGDNVVYTAVLRNQNGTFTLPAWDFELTQTLPPELTTATNPVMSAILSRGNVDVSACVSIIGQVVTLDASCLPAGQNFIGRNESITLMLEAQVDSDIRFEQTVNATATASATSLPGAQGTANATPGLANTDTGERTGDRVANDSAESVNDLFVVANASVTAEAPTVNLRLSENALQIAEQVTISVEIGLPTGRTEDFFANIDFPAGLRYEGTPIRLTTPSSNFSSSNTPNVNPAAGSDPISLNFGEITNASTSAQSIIIELDAIVDNVATNQNGTQLDTIVSLDYLNVGTNIPSDSENLRVVEANLEVLQTITAGATASDAGDSISYRTVVSNTSSAASAYNLSFADVFPADLLGASSFTVSVTNPANAVVLSNTNTAVGAGDFSTSTTTIANDTVALSGTMTIPPNASIILEYDALVSSSASAGATLTNVAAVSYTSDEANNGRDGSDSGSDDDTDTTLNNYNESASSSLVLANELAIQSQLNPIHSDNDFAPGDSVFIDIRIDLSEGKADNASITNALPPGLSFVGSSVASGENISYSGDAVGVVDSSNNVSFNFGSVNNIPDNDASNDFFILTVEALVDNINSNSAGTSLSNTANAAAAGETVGPTSLELDIIEPNVTASISTSKTAITLGDVASFSVDIAANELGTDAFDTQFEIVIPSGFTYQSGSLIGPGIIDDSDPTRLVIDLGAASASDGNKRFVFDAQLNNDAPIGSNFEFAIENGRYSSQAGASASEREYNFSDTLSVQSDDSSFIDATQSLNIVTDNNNNGIADPGDILGKSVLITNNGPRVGGVTFDEAFPSSTSYVPGSLNTTKGSIDDSSSAAVDIGELASGEQVTINFSIEVDANTPAGTLIRAQGSVNSDATIPELTDADGNDSNGDQANEIRVGDTSALTPSLSASQSITQFSDTDGDGAVSASDIVEFSYTFTNAGSMNLSNVDLTDALPQGLSFIANSIAISGPADANDSASVSGTSVTANIASLSPNESVTVSFQASINNPLIDLDGDSSSEVFSAQGTVGSDQTQPILTDSNGNVVDGAQPSSITAVASGAAASPNIAVSQTYVLVNDIDGDGIVDPGDTVELLTTITNNGSATARNVEAGQPIPADTSLVPGSQQTSKGVVTNPGNTQFNANIGSIDPGETVVTRFDVIVDASLNIDTVISSQQSVSGSNFTNLDSDSNADLSDGATPTLINVFSSGSPAYSLNTVLSATSNAGTTGNSFIQGESLSVELEAVFPQGLTRDGQLSFTLPTGMTYQSNTAQLKRVFDSSISAGANPGAVNSASSDSFVSVPVQVVGSTVTLNLGNVLSGDNDADLASLILALDIDTSAVVPNAASQSFAIESSLAYNDESQSAQSLQSNDVVVVLENRPPTAVADSLTINEDAASSTILPLANDSDADSGQTLLLVNAGPGSNGGTVTLNSATGEVQYTPAPNFFGTETIPYTVSDGAGGVSTSTITATVTPQPDPPTANNDLATTPEETPVTINVLANDEDVDGDTISVLSANANNGSVSVNPDGSLVFTPDPEFSGAAIITYTISDGNGGTDTATVTVNVTPTNDNPTAIGQNLTTPEDTALVIDPLLGANDIDGDTLSATNLASSSGTVTINPDGTLNFVPAPNFNGPVSITYDIVDGNGGIVSVTTTVDVTPLPDAPIAVADVASTVEDTPVVVNVLANDSDPDSDALSVIAATSPNGSVTILPNGDIEFTPNPDFNGLAVVTYTLQDATGLVDTGTVSIDVSAVNDAPQVPDQIIAAVEDTAVSFDPLANGFDQDGDALSISDLTVSSGTLVQNPDGTITFTPDPDFNGPVTVTYNVSDGKGGLTPVTVQINVEPEIDPPVAGPDTASTQEDMPVTINAIANDSDPDGDAISITSAVSPDGTTSIDANGEVVFTPKQDFVGEAQITYTLTDSTGEVTTGTIVVDVTAVNDAPVASDQTVVTLEDMPLVIDLLLNASDVDGDPLNLSNLSVDSGSISLNADGTVSFTPDPDFNGPVELTYTIDDGQGGSVDVTVFINVQEVVDAPVANPDFATTNEDEPLSIDVLSNDTDVDSTELSVVQASSMQGSVSIDPDGNLTFTPNQDFNGEAIINYTIEDESGQMASTSVTVEVLPVNDPPVTQDSSVTMSEDTVLNLDLISDASDADGDSLIISSIASDIGEVSIGPDGSVFFMPPENYFGPATITYTVDDGNGGTSTATVTINVQPINDEPIAPPIDTAVPSNQTSIINVTDLVTDVESSTFEIVSTDLPIGEVVINDDGTISYTPPTDFVGLVMGEVCIRDEQGIEVCSDITIDVVSSNTAPVALDQSISTAEDTSITFTLDATDAEGQSLSYSLLSSPDGTVLGSGPQYTFIPNENFNGITSFSYQVSDGIADSNAATVTITVLAVNDAPEAVDDFVEILQDQGPVTIDALVNDSDPDGDSISISSASADNGTVEIVDGELVYTPAPGFVGDDFIEYSIIDDEGESAIARVIVSVGQGNNNPVLNTPADITIDATGLFTKVDLGIASAFDQLGNPLPVSIEDGLVLYPPGVNVVTYITEDSQGRRTTAQQIVRVNPLVSIQNDQSVTEGSQVVVTVHLNGPSPSYPLVVPYSVSGTASNSDHELLSGQVVFDNTTEVTIVFDTFTDADIEGTESVVITLSDSVNIGENFQHVVNIVESNVQPSISLFAVQDSQRRSTLAVDGGLVTIDSLIEHPDPNNEYSFEWLNVEMLLNDVDSNDKTYTFDPSTAAPGIYEFTVRITDIDDPSFSDTAVVFLEVVESLPSLTSDDSDGDGISDEDEGLSDSDGDGISDYLDNISECNVLPQEVNVRDRNLIEGEAGACLRIGRFALGSASGGALIYPELVEGISGLSNDTVSPYIGGLNDFSVYDMPSPGQRYEVVLPQRRPIPENAVYRNFSSSAGWQTFTQGSGNALFSAAGEPGFCPAPGSAEYQPGLVAGSWCVQVQIVDGGPNDADATINLGISNTGYVGVIDADLLPDAIDDSTSTLVEQAVNIDALANDIDPAQGGLMISSVNAFFGEVSIIVGADGEQIRYTPAPGFSGIDEIRYGIVDANGLSDVAVITISVEGNLPPIAVNDDISAALSAPTLISPLVNDSDPEGGELSIISASSSDGDIEILSDGRIRFTANAGVSGTALIIYTIEDEFGLIATAQIRIESSEETLRIENKSDGGGSMGPYGLLLLALIGFYRRADKKGPCTVHQGDKL